MSKSVFPQYAEIQEPVLMKILIDALNPEIYPPGEVQATQLMRQTDGIWVLRIDQTIQGRFKK